MTPATVPAPAAAARPAGRWPRCSRPARPAVGVVGHPADRPLQDDVAHHEGREPERAGLGRHAGADGIDRQEAEGDLLAEAAGEGREHGERRQHDDLQVAAVLGMLDPRRGLPIGQQRHRHQQRQARAGEERHRPVDADDLQHQRPQRQAERHQHGVDAMTRPRASPRRRRSSRSRSPPRARRPSCRAGSSG